MKKSINKMIAVLASIGMVAATTMPAFAADATDAEVQRDTAKIYEYIVADPDVALSSYGQPSGSLFPVSIEKLSLNDSQDTDALAIMPALTISQYANNSTTSSANYTTTAKGVEIGGVTRANSIGSDLQSSGTKPIGATLNFKYASTSNLDVSETTGIKWPQAGVYKYYITNTTNSDTTARAAEWQYNTGVVDGTPDGYVVSVYVLNTSGLVTKYVQINKATKSDNTITVGDKIDDTDTSTGRGFAFVNKFTPLLDLAVKQNLLADMDDSDRYFEYKVNITLPTGMTNKAFTVVPDAASYVASTTNNQTAVTNPTTITSGTETTFYLKDNNITIKDLPAGSTYTVTLDAVAGYKYTYKVIQAGISETAVVGNVNTAATASGKMKTKGLASGNLSPVKTNEVDFTTTSTNKVPTGIVTSGIAGLAAVLGAGLLLIVSRRRKEDE